MNMNSTNLSEARISDFGLVAALLTGGFTTVRTEREGNRLFFVFVRNNELQKAMSSYWAGTLLVSALQYFETTKGLKSRIYSE